MSIGTRNLIRYHVSTMITSSKIVSFSLFMNYIAFHLAFISFENAIHNIYTAHKIHNLLVQESIRCVFSQIIELSFLMIVEIK